MEDEILTVGKLNEKIKLNEKKIKCGKIQLEFMEEYIKKGDFSKVLDFGELAEEKGNEEFRNLRHELGVHSTIDAVKAGINGAEEAIKRDKILMRNPKIQRQR